MCYVIYSMCITEEEGKEFAGTDVAKLQFTEKIYIRYKK